MKPLCSYPECPWRFDPDEHRVQCGGVPGHPHTHDIATHQHKPRRSQMKNPPIVALLCPALHDMVDNSTAFKDAVVVHEGRRFYRLWKPGEEHRPDKWALLWREIPTNGTNDSGPDNRAVPRDLHPGFIQGRETVVDVLPDAQDGRGSLPDSAQHDVEVRSSDEGTEELTDELGTVGADSSWADSCNRNSDVDRGLSSVRPDSDVLRNPGLTFEAWAEEVRIWAKTYRSMGWIFGDLCLKGLDRWEEAHQVIDRELGVDEGTIANWLTTCRTWPPESRRHEASFTMHALLNATRRKDAEEADRMLDEAISEGRTSSEVRALLAGPVGSHECPDCGASHRRKT